jgi:alkaline phosphatase D
MKNLKLFSRRNFLKSAGFIGGVLLVHPQGSIVLAKPQYKSFPFSLGVASGEPYPDSVVIWTRLAAESLSETLALATISVQWQVAKDEKMTSIIAQGEALAEPILGHSVHVVVEGLKPDQVYWYRFQTNGEKSPIGRTKTAPIGSPKNLSFAFVSCQNYEHGYFNAYSHLAKENLDFVVHLGDYIYEGASKSSTDFPRSHDSPEPVDLEGYRQRYSLYRSDENLQEAHRLFPFICTWDDHEVENDYANLTSENFDDINWFRNRRAAAYQAYYEFLPLRPFSRPQSENMQLYRRLDWGDLARFYILDGRQYRDDQPCSAKGKGGGQIIPDCAERLEPTRSLLGKAQENWLQEELSSSKAHWNIIAQQYLVSQLKRIVNQEPAFWSDGWDGYPANRQRIIDFIAEKGISNPIFIGGDIHSFWVSEVHRDFDDPNSPIVAADFVGTSISSNGIPYEQVTAVLPQNTHVKFFESRLRGYVKCDVSREVWQAKLQVVDTVKEINSQLSTLATFAVKSGSSIIEKIS